MPLLPSGNALFTGWQAPVAGTTPSRRMGPHRRKRIPAAPFGPLDHMADSRTGAAPGRTRARRNHLSRNHLSRNHLASNHLGSKHLARADFIAALNEDLGKLRA